MPIFYRVENGKHFFQYGDQGKKYYFDPDSSRTVKIAYKLCLRQARAIKASQNKK